jgi:pimeloyl-ACP methyl ester carboxylesterase
MSVNGGLEYFRSGEGPAVLLLHGAMGGYDQSVRLGQAAIGETGFDGIAVSRPGYLGTPLSAGRKPEEQADLCARLLDTLGVEQTAVVAVSGGGQCALQFALRHAERCQAVVMISAVSAPLAVKIPLRFQALSFLAHFPTITARMQKKAAANFDKAAQRSIPDPVLRAEVLNDPEVGPIFRDHVIGTFDRMSERIAGTENDIAQSRLPFDYPVEQIAAPVLVVHGTDDEAVPFAQAEALASRVKCGELLAIEGGRHVSLFTHRQLIQTRVRAFLGLL